MNDKPKPSVAKLVHLNKESKLSPEGAHLRDLELTIAGHFREQNEILHANNADLALKLQRLTNGIECLVSEMHGVRTGKKAEAFARIAGIDADPDLPSVSAEAALVYTETSTSIGDALGFRASQIGQLLGPNGLGWAGNGDYQEVGRKAGPSASKFWHREVPQRLRVVLDENKPEQHGVIGSGALAVFRKWNAAK